MHSHIEVAHSLPVLGNTSALLSDELNFSVMAIFFHILPTLPQTSTLYGLQVKSDTHESYNVKIYIILLQEIF